MHIEIFEQLRKDKIIGETAMLCKQKLKMLAQWTNDSRGPGSRLKEYVYSLTPHAPKSAIK
jgi:hypothetical protein